MTPDSLKFTLKQSYSVRLNGPAFEDGKHALSDRIEIEVARFDFTGNTPMVVEECNEPVISVTAKTTKAVGVELELSGIVALGGLSLDDGKRFLIGQLEAEVSRLNITGDTPMLVSEFSRPAITVEAHDRVACLSDAEAVEIVNECHMELWQITEGNAPKWLDGQPDQLLGRWYWDTILGTCQQRPAFPTKADAARDAIREECLLDRLSYASGGF